MENDPMDDAGRFIFQGAAGFSAQNFAEFAANQFCPFFPSRVRRSPWGAYLVNRIFIPSSLIHLRIKYILLGPENHPTSADA